MNDDDLVKWINGEVREAKIKTADWRKNARECYAFYAGKQWSDTDESLLAEQGRPAVVFNRTARTINSISGLEVQNRQEVRFIPRETTDTKVSDVLSAAAKWVRDNCDAEDEESESFQDALICGMGWTETSLEYERNPDGDIIVERDDPLFYFWDWKAKKRNLDDARWRAKVYLMSEKEVKEKWPKWDGISKGEAWIEDEEEPHDSTPPFYDGKTQNQGGKKPIEVLCFQWYEKEDFHRVQLPDGRIIELSTNKFNKLKESLDAMGTPYVSQKRRKYMKAYVIGSSLLGREDLEVQNGFTYNAITGLRDRNNNIWFGVVSLMLDPQRWANKWLSQIMHILNSNSKGGLLAEKDAFENPRKAEKEWADPTAITWLNQGGMGKVEQKTISQMPSGIEGLMRYAVESINDVPGVNLEMMGMANRDQPGILETSRKQAGVTMLAVFFDSFRRYRKEQGRILAKMITEYIADGRLIRIVGKDGADVIPLLKDPMTFQYDIVVDDAPTSPNQKERIFAVLMQIMPQMLQAGIPVPPEVVDYLPLPAGLTEEWKKLLKPSPEAEQAKQQEAEQMKQMGMQAQSAQIYKDKTAGDLNAAKAQEVSTTQNDYNTETESDAALKQSQAHVNTTKAGLNQIDALVKLTTDTVKQ